MKPKIFKFFDTAINLKASDLILKPNAPPVYRQNKHLIVSEEEPIAPQEMYDLLLPILDITKQNQISTTMEASGLFPYKRKGRIKYYVFQQREGFAGNFRFLPPKVPTIQELRLPEILIELACRPRGLFLVTGPAGSGKTHTMAAMINAINQRFARHIITLENPIEFIYEPQKSVFTQIEVGTNIQTYQEAIANALRQDPDVILIGEMTDRKTIEMALVASETGHFVISTLPTIGAVQTIDRIVSFFPPEKHEEVFLQISINLVGIFSQMLIPRISPEQPAGLAYELMVATQGIRTMIREQKLSQIQSAMLMAKKDGCVTLKDSLSRLLRDETINSELVKALLQEIVE